MSATSGIQTSPELTKAFTDANERSSNVRFLLVSIENELLVPKQIIDISHASLENDLTKLQDVLENDVPTYILARLGGQGEPGWLAISYIPDTANIRGKMLYASTRASLMKSLGSTHFPDSLFANSKADLTPSSYAEHKAHNSAPHPLSPAEKEIADAREAERSTSIHEGMSARRNHVGSVPGTQWSEEATNAVKAIGETNNDEIIILKVDIKTETLVVASASPCKVGEVSQKIPAQEPSFALFAWNHNHGSSPQRDIVYIYSCPSNSPVKSRMIYSATCRALYHVAKGLLSDSSSTLVSRTVETSDPSEIDENFLVYELGLEKESNEVPLTERSTGKLGGAANSFAKPRGPARKR